MRQTEALQKLMALCSQREKCTHDIREKLLQWNIETADQEQIINTLINEKFIDDSRYATAAVKDKFRFNKWGKIKISWFLKAKNIEKAIIDDALQVISDSEYRETLSELMKQKQKQIKDPDLYKKKAKVIRFVTSRGFEYNMAMEEYQDKM